MVIATRGLSRDACRIRTSLSVVQLMVLHHRQHSVDRIQRADAHIFRDGNAGHERLQGLAHVLSEIFFMLGQMSLSDAG
jgi:hypothetical protein